LAGAYNEAVTPVITKRLFARPYLATVKKRSKK